MSPYGLRQSPKPSKRMLEAGEVSDELERTVKKRKSRFEEEKESEASVEASTALKAVTSSAVHIEATPNISNDSDKTQVSGPPTRKRKANVKTGTVKPAKRRNLNAQQPIILKRAHIVVKSYTDSETQIKNPIIPKTTIDMQYEASKKPSPSITKAHLALDASIRAHLKHENPSPKQEVQPKKNKDKNVLRSVNVPNLHSLAVSRGPQRTPDGKGIDLSPASLPSPEKPYTPFRPDPEVFPSKKHIHLISKQVDRRLVPPNYSPYDIVSGGKPPDLSEAEEEFWNDRLGGVWQQEELPDQHGRLWKCVKMVGEDFQEDVGWTRGGTKGDAAGEDVSPGSAVEDFEREVELFLNAFGEELPEWSSVLGDVDQLDYFGED